MKWGAADGNRERSPLSPSFVKNGTYHLRAIAASLKLTTPPVMKNPARQPRTSDGFKLLELDFHTIDFQSAGCRSVFNGDCQPLMRICCGIEPLRNDDLRPILERISHKVFDIYSYGWIPLLWFSLKIYLSFCVTP